MPPVKRKNLASSLSTAFIPSQNKRTKRYYSKQKIYAVANGRKCGIFEDWSTCEKQVEKFPGALFKSFNSREQAQHWLHTQQNGTQSESVQQNLAPNSVTVEYQPVKFPCTKISFPATFPRRAEVDSQQSLVRVYTDGSCLGNGGKVKAAGIGVFFGPDDHRNAGEPLRYPGPLTNQRAEIAAAIRALQIIREQEESAEQQTKTEVAHGSSSSSSSRTMKSKHVEIITDSKYVINAMQSWIYSWERNNWKSSTGKDVMNMDLFFILINLVQERFDNGSSCVKWTHIAGHKGLYGNTEADELAVAGSRKLQSERQTR